MLSCILWFQKQLYNIGPREQCQPHEGWFTLQPTLHIITILNGSHLNMFNQYTSTVHGNMKAALRLVSLYTMLTLITVWEPERCLVHLECPVLKFWPPVSLEIYTKLGESAPWKPFFPHWINAQQTLTFDWQMSFKHFFFFINNELHNLFQLCEGQFGSRYDPLRGGGDVKCRIVLPIPFILRS